MEKVDHRTLKWLLNWMENISLQDTEFDADKESMILRVQFEWKLPVGRKMRASITSAISDNIDKDKTNDQPNS